MTGPPPQPAADVRAGQGAGIGLSGEGPPAATRRAAYAVAVVLLLEYALFRQFALREIVWAVPAGSDQLGYLTLAYRAYEDILARGLVRGLGATLREPNTVALVPAADILFLVLGPSRLTALTLNFLYFALLQVVFAGSLYWLTRRWALVFLGLGLLLAVQTPFFVIGGMADFRADFGAFCLFGVFMSVVIRSGVFADARWSAVAGVAAAWLVLHRVLTLVYLAGIVGVVLVCWLARVRPASSATSRTLTRRRFTGLSLAGLVFAILTGPLLWQNRRAIWLYYATPETGPEKTLRQSLAGIRSAWDVVRFYPESLVGGHLGWRFWIVAGVAVAVLWVLRRASARGPAPLLVDRPDAVLFAAACLVVPLGVLTAVPIKWTTLTSILVPPVLWLVMLLLAWLWPGEARRSGRLLERLPWALAILGLGVGLVAHVADFGARTVPGRSHVGALELLRLYDTIAQHSLEMGWAAPRLLVDHVSDSVNWAGLMPMAYERHHRLFRSSPSLHGLWAVSESDARAALERSDFVVLTVGKPPSSSRFPFDHAMDAVRPALKSLCDRDFLNLGTFRPEDGEMVLYARPGPRLAGPARPPAAGESVP